MKKYFLLVLLILSSVMCTAQYIVRSPDSKVKLYIDNTAQNGLHGRITFGNQLVLSLQMGNFEFINSPNLHNGLKVISAGQKRVNEVWRPVLKRYAKVNNSYDQLTLNVAEMAYPKRRFLILARVYNDGVAYRTIFLESKSGVALAIKEENAGFDFGADRTCWVADHEKFISPQETFFYKQKLSQIKPSALVGLPFTFKISPNCYASITEADLTDYAGMYLKKLQSGKQFQLTSVLAPSVDSAQLAKVTQKAGTTTPWRTVILGKNSGKLVESELVNNLNPPCAITDPSWIKPGISAWDNWFSYGVKMDHETVKKYIDLAGEMNWPYMIVDWQWYGQYDDPKADITRSAAKIDLPQLISYAKERNVRLILWLYWTDVNRADWDKVCALYESWGIAGVKIDFMNRDDQTMVNWYTRITKTAAQHKLLVDFHGAYKPTGMGRTYPNQITREGVMGNEWNKWSTMITPEHLCTLPFTRMLAGPLDFTPGCFENRTAENFRIESPTNTMVTRSNALAQFVIFDSPLTVACDHPDNYRGQTGTEFLEKVKTVWDDTKVLSGEIGDHIVMARRNGSEWFIGAFNNSLAKTKKVKLNFLGKGKYLMTSYNDDTITYKAVQKSKTVTAADEVTLQMAPGGGFAAYLQPVK